MQVLQEIKNMAVHTQLVFWLLKYKLCLLFGSALCNMYKFMSIMSSVLEKDFNTSKRCISTAKFCLDIRSHPS